MAKGVNCPPFLQPTGNRERFSRLQTRLAIPISNFGISITDANRVTPLGAASLLWIMLELVAFLCLLKAILTISEAGECRPKAQYLVLSALAFAPFQTAINLGNISLLAFALGAAAVALALSGRGICWAPFAAALCLKPTIALPFLIYLLVARRWRSVLAACAGSSVLFLAAAGRMLVSGTSWFPDFLLNSRNMFSQGAVNDFSSTNPLRFDLINLQLVTFPLAHSRRFAQLLAAVVALLFLALWYRFRASTGAIQSPLLDLAFLASVALMPLYHRFYDASLLFLGVAWALGEIEKCEDRHALLALIFASPFLLPGAALLASLSDRIRFLGMAQSWWWGTLVLSHQAWMVLLFSMTLLMAMRAWTLPAVNRLGQLRAAQAGVSLHTELFVSESGGM